jgi:hypothetical protein
MWVIFFLLLICVESAFVLQTGEDSFMSFPVTVFKSGPAWNDEFKHKFENASVRIQGFTPEFDLELCFQDKLIQEALPSAGSVNPVLVITYVPSCYPEDIAKLAARYGYAGLAMGTPSVVPGIFSLIFWKNRNPADVPIPVFEVPLTDSNHYNCSWVSISPDENYFTSQEFVAISEFFNVLMLGLSLAACRLGYTRIKANWTGFKSMNLAIWICILELFGIAWRLVLCVDLSGILHILSFPTVLVLGFFSLFPGMISTYLVSMRLHLILLKESSHEFTRNGRKWLIVISSILLVWFLGFELYTIYGISTLTVSTAIVMIRIGNGALLQLFCLGFFVKARVSLIKGLKK